MATSNSKMAISFLFFNLEQWKALWLCFILRELNTIDRNTIEFPILPQIKDDDNKNGHNGLQSDFYWYQISTSLVSHDWLTIDKYLGLLLKGITVYTFSPTMGFCRFWISSPCWIRIQLMPSWHWRAEIDIDTFQNIHHENDNLLLWVNRWHKSISFVSNMIFLVLVIIFWLSRKLSILEYLRWPPKWLHQKTYLYDHVLELGNQHRELTQVQKDSPGYPKLMMPAIKTSWNIIFTYKASIKMNQNTTW